VVGNTQALNLMQMRHEPSEPRKEASY